MDYNKLATFLKVAEKLSVTAAARELGRTQSAITQQLKLLEEELGFSLLERKHGRVFLTPQGEKLAAAGTPSLGRLDDEVARLRDDLKAVEGTLSVGVLDDYGTQCLGPRIASFCAAHPRVRVALHYGTSSTVEDWLLANRVDLGILVNFRDKSLFETREVAIEEHVPAASRAYLKSHGPIATIDRLVQADLVDFTEDFLCFRVWVGKNRKSLLPALLKRKPALTLQSHYGVKSVVASGFGAAMLPRYLLDKEVVELVPSAKPIRVGHDLAFRSKRTLRLVERRFVDFISRA